jgi:hypothetical protein
MTRSSVLASLPIALALLQACATNSPVTQSGVGGSGASSTSSDASTTTSSGGGAGGGAGIGGASAASTTTSATTATTTSSTTSGGGAGGGGGPWPVCDAAPDGVPTKTLHTIWQENPSAPTPVWVPGLYVTAISRAGCEVGAPCQIFVQEQESFADLASAAQRAMKIFVSGATAEHFVGLAVGDQLDVYAHAWRYDVSGEDELLLQVNLQYQGCAKKVGQGTPLPVTATLDDLTLAAYEQTLGPVLVKVDTLVGKPHLPDETFAVFESGVFDDAGLEEIVSLSPFFLPNAAFTGLVPEALTNFTSVTGAFGLFIPEAQPIVKYKEIYPRTMADVVYGGQ